jgi:hypothetical protein
MPDVRPRIPSTQDPFGHTAAASRDMGKRPARNWRSRAAERISFGREDG